LSHDYQLTPVGGIHYTTKYPKCVCNKRERDR
jgi:hypothetical protein